MNVETIIEFGLGSAYGGIENVVYSLRKEFINNCVHFVFISPRKEIAYEKEFISFGDEVYHVTDYRKSIKKYRREVIELLKKYDAKTSIIHLNLSSYRNFLLIDLIKKSGFRFIIHGHNAGDLSKIKHLLHLFFRRYYSKIGVKVACSKKSGQYMFGNNPHIVINNGIDSEKFNFNVEFRKIFREKYNIKDGEVLIGNIGRISKEKNSIFLIKLIEKYQDIFINNRIKVIFVGIIDDKEFVNAYNSLPLNIKERIILVGEVKQSIEKYYSMIDIFVNTSPNEAFPLVKAEAMASGLIVLTSKGTPLFNIEGENEKCYQIDLIDLDKWIKIILHCLSFVDGNRRNNIINGSRLDIKHFSQSFMEIIQQI